MERNDLLRMRGVFFRVLAMRDDSVLLIDCLKQTMPVWTKLPESEEWKPCSEEELQQATGITLVPVEELQADRRRTAFRRYTWIAGILPCIDNEAARSAAIQYAAEQNHLSAHTIRRILCRYLAFQTVSALAPKEPAPRALTLDEKSFRWALNKFFYTKHKNTLRTAYEYMLKERYCDTEGNLLSEIPAFHRFKYFYYKTRKMETFYISRNGMKDYKKNHRPLVGGTVQDYAGNVGMAFADSTVLDVFLVDEAGNLIARPLLACAVDVFSGLILGYALSLEGGVYSLRGLMQGIIEDKVALCKRFGIEISEEDWPCRDVLPSQIVVDNGTDYASGDFEHLTELNVTIIQAPPWRPDLKSKIEKTFDVIQSLYAPMLKGHSFIDVDFAERGAIDYRLESHLTMRQMETIILRTILYLNRNHVLENYPYTDEMLEKGVRPYATDIWRYGLQQPGACLIPVTAKQLQLTLLPRTQATFTRYGLVVNRLRYHREGFKNEYLKGGKATVAYNPDDVTGVWLIRNGEYLKFDLVEVRFAGKTLSEAQEMKQRQKELNRSQAEEELQAKIELTRHIEAIVAQTAVKSPNFKNVRKNRKRARTETHHDYLKELQDE